MGTQKVFLSCIIIEFVENIHGTQLTVDETLGHFSLVMQHSSSALDHLAACAKKGAG